MTNPYIKSAHIQLNRDGGGFFLDQTMNFGSGLNIISGENGTGKTKVHTFLKSYVAQPQVINERATPRVTAFSPKRNASKQAIVSLLAQIRMNGVQLSQLDGERLGANIQDTNFEAYRSFSEYFVVLVEDQVRVGNITYETAIESVRNEFQSVFERVFPGYQLTATWENRNSEIYYSKFEPNINARKDIDMIKATEKYKFLPQYRCISYEELKKHSTYSDAWVSINGTVYDITDFIPKHPFGDTFRGSLGTECSGLFTSSHIGTNVDELITNEQFLEINGIKTIGRLDVTQDYLHKDNNDKYLDRLVYKKSSDDGFWLELNTKIKEYLVENNESIHYTAFEGKMYLLYYSAVFILLSYLTWINHSIFSAILLGFHMVCASTNMSHMVTHYGFTKNKSLDFIAAHFFDLCGLSWLEWQIIHQTHHHQPHSCIDYQTNQYAPIRIHKYMERKPHHKYQRIYFWLAILTYHFRALPMSTIWLIVNKEFVRHKYEMATHILARLVLLIFIFYCGYLHGFWNAILIFSVYSISCSYSAFLLLYNDHEETHNVLALNRNINLSHNEFSWAEIQVRTSGNWYPTNWFLSFIEFHFGYFNYHIEHHLFPAFKPSLLKKISLIVKSVCSKHGIPYISTTFVEVHKSFQRHITKMGASPEESKIEPSCAENLEV